MLKLRYLTLALPLAMQMSAISAGAVASEDDDKPQVITITAVDVESDELKKAAEEKVRAAKVQIEAKVQKARAELDQAKAAVEKARAVPKPRPAGVVEARVAPPDVLTLIGKAEDFIAEDQDGQGKRVTVRGQFKLMSPDGKVFEVFVPDGPRVLQEKLAEPRPDKLPPVNRGYAIFKTIGDEPELKSEDFNKLIGELTARVKDTAEAPRFVIGVSVSEAPAVVLSQIGRPEEAAVVVDTVVNGSPAEKAGVKKLDLILKAAGEPVKSAGELTKAVKSADGREVELVLIRGGKELTVHIKPKSNEPAPRKTKIADGTIQFGPGIVLDGPATRWVGPPGQMGIAPGHLTEEIKALRKDIEELKKMIEELKAAK